MGLISKKTKFYSLKNILSKKSQYNMIFGERSNGKTYAVLEYALKNYIAGKGKLGLVRRWQDDFRGKRGATMFNSLESTGAIEKITNGEWTNIYYYASRWWLCRYDEKLNRETSTEPFAFAFAISAMEHDKSTSYPDITTIMFDEFLTRGMYLPDEFVLFMNVVSTIVRHRDDVKIFMLGNTVNQYSPYFSEMGLTHVRKMESGDIDVYTYGESGLRVAVEYADTLNKNKPSDLYFAFNNPKLTMITGGTWEIDIYPHLPEKYRPKDILFTYFIIFNDDILQCEIIQIENRVFTYIHRKTTELKDTYNDLIFTCEYDNRPNYKRKITNPTSEIEKKIAMFFKRDKVFYQNNEVGEIIRNYLLWCKEGTFKQ